MARTVQHEEAMTTRAKKPPTVCRFCGESFMVSQLKMHVQGKHKAEWSKITEHANARAEPANLAKGFGGSGGASTGREFRRATGYASSAAGAEQRDDGDEK